MSTRRTIGAMLAIAAVGLVAVWLYAIAGSTEQLRALFLAGGGQRRAVSASQPPRVVNRAPPTPVGTPQDRPLIVQESAAAPVAAAGVDAEDSASTQSAGPISGANFAELLDSGLVGEEDDPDAAAELRNALRAAEAAAEPE